VAPDQRDGRVLEALLLHLLADTNFNMQTVSHGGPLIVLFPRTPEKTGFLQPHQMRSDIRDHVLPVDAEADLRRRNSLLNAKADTYDAVSASWTNLAFGAGVVVADNLTATRSQPFADVSFGKTHPKARAWVQAYLPGYSKDGTRAIVRAEVGPTAHGATITALLERTNGAWRVKWHALAVYV
jgi:hypothetical protein